MVFRPTARFRKYMGVLLRLKEKADEVRGDVPRFSTIRDRFYRELWQEAARDVGATLTDLGEGYLQISRGAVSTFVNRSEVDLDSRLILKIAGHKPLSYRLLADEVPLARHHEFDLSGLDEAFAWVEEVGTAVVKPALAGSAGRGVTTGVNSRAKLRRAALCAAASGERMLLEEQLGGASFRLLYLRGELVDAIRRDPPTVTGDGQSTIRELVSAENERRLADPPTSMHPLAMDLEMKSHLGAQGHSLATVLSSGTRINVKLVANQNADRENHSVLESVHPSIVEMGSRVAKRLNVRLGGLDLLTADIAKPLSETGGVVSELNTTPAFHHHYLISDRSRAVPVARLVLHAILEPRATLAGSLS